jgi:hypothetical protein
MALAILADGEGEVLRTSSKNKGGIFELLRSPGIDSKESIPPAYVA